MITLLTHAECMARLMACPALPRGERYSCVPVDAEPAVWWWVRHMDDVLRPELREGTREDAWRRLAAPLRRAREERQRATRREQEWKETAMILFGRSNAVLEKGQEYKDSLFTLMVGAALLGFFTDLAILVRKTPALCPCCSGDMVEASGDPEFPVWFVCVACCCRMRMDMWNRVAIPAAFARLKDGE